MRRGFILFRPDGGDGGSGGTPPADPPAGGTPPAIPPAGDPPPTGKTFTQAELDAIVQKEKAKAEKAAREAAASEASKAKLDEVERLKVEKQESDQRAADAIATANTALVKAEARVQAMALGVSQERLEYALRLADLSGIEVANGVVPAEEVKKALSVVLTDIPELKGQAAGGASRSGGDFQGGGEKRIWTRAEIAALAGTPEFETHKADINAAAIEGRIRG